MPNFNNLLHKVLAGTATEHEYREFEKMVQSDEYDDQLTAEGLSRQKLQESALWKKMTDNVYQRMEPNINASGKTLRLQHSRAWLAAAAIVVITMVAGAWFVSNNKLWFNQELAEETRGWSIISVKGIEKLPDGTVVTLNANSELRYDRSFGKTSREVTLTGEATFDVVHAPSKPFLVRTGKVTTKVLGTEFNVKAYTDQPQVTVTVLRGLVEVQSEDQILGQIKPNEQIAINTDTREFVQQVANAQAAVQWRSNFLVLDNVSLEEAAKTIEDKFDVKITFENEALKKCRYFGSFLNNESLNDVLTSISIAMRIEFEIEKNMKVVTLRGKGCE